MKLIDQHTKRIMEGCKERAWEAGLRFEPETLEYIITNNDMTDLTAKNMIPTLYDYWVHDVDVLQGRGKYELYPNNPFETVINTRPAISFYNDNNPDWLNVMIFYHVLAHIDFFHNNQFYAHTWSDDFGSIALAHKRQTNKLRSEHGQRAVDYVIEWARCLDNLVGYSRLLFQLDAPDLSETERMIDYYFDHFLQAGENRRIESVYQEKIHELNELIRRHGQKAGRQFFLQEVAAANVEFNEAYKRYRKKQLEDQAAAKPDLMQFIMDHSRHLNQEKNRWKKEIIEIVRQTSLYFQPQIRTKIMNEGWATYWHEKLFLDDERIKGHEAAFAKVHSRVASLSKVGLNPYAIGSRLFEYVKEMGDKGRISFEFDRLADAETRKKYDKKQGRGLELIFEARKYLSDAQFIRRYLDQAFMDRYKLYVVGKRLDRVKRRYVYYVKSRKAEAYKRMLLDGMYHPPYIYFREAEAGEIHNQGTLVLEHENEGKPLKEDYIYGALLGVGELWGDIVELHTQVPSEVWENEDGSLNAEWMQVIYTMEKREMTVTQ